MDEDSRALLRLLIARLERISADSRLAHQASGVRRSLLDLLEMAEAGRPIPAARFTHSVDRGFSLLRRAFEERVG
jgi:hypothetical protein